MELQGKKDKEMFIASLIYTLIFGALVEYFFGWGRGLMTIFFISLGTFLLNMITTIILCVKLDDSSIGLGNKLRNAVSLAMFSCGLGAVIGVVLGAMFGSRFGGDDVGLGLLLLFMMCIVISACLFVRTR